MTIEKLINELETNASTLKKAELISEFTDKTLLKEILFYTLNPYYNYYIKKLPEMKTGKLNFEKGWEWVKPLLVDLNARLTTGHEAIRTTVGVLESLNPEAQEIAKRILFRDLRCSVSDKISNKVFPGLVPEFKVQLANKYDPAKKYKNTLWAASRKMDGCLSYETIIKFEDGRNLKIGDVVKNKIKGKIKTLNINTKKVEYHDIKNWMKNFDDVNEKNYEWYEIELENGEKIKLTGNHRIWLPELKCYRKVEELRKNDKILFENNK